MKKLISAVGLVAFMGLTLAACGPKAGGTGDKPTTTQPAPAGDPAAAPAGGAGGAAPGAPAAAPSRTP